MSDNEKNIFEENESPEGTEVSENIPSEVSEKKTTGDELSENRETEKVIADGVSEKEAIEDELSENRETEKVIADEIPVIETERKETPDIEVKAEKIPESGAENTTREKGAAAVLTEEYIRRKNKHHSGLKKFGALAAGVAVIGCFIGAGYGVGHYIHSEGGISATVGSDLNIASVSDGEDAAPIAYTANYSSITELFKTVKNSVVNINMTMNATNMWYQTYETTGSGSGIIYKIDGDNVYIVTNNHVISGVNTVTVSVTGEEQIPASLVGKDENNEIAVIKVSKADLEAAGISDIKPIEFVRTDSTEIGETVLAIGNALGLGKTVTQGIISAKDKTINIDGKALTVLQSDAAINPGNSGGALVNLDGKVIGINTAKPGTGTYSEGMGYAIPSHIAAEIADQLIENGSVEKPYLGVVCFTINDSFRQMYNIDVSGVFVREVYSESAAEKAGIVASDIITAANGKTVTSQEDLQNIISGLKVGDKLNIDFVRNGREKKSTTAVLENYSEKF